MDTNITTRQLNLTKFVLSLLIAVSTNHSLGEIVHQKDSGLVEKGKMQILEAGSHGATSALPIRIAEIIHRADGLYALVFSSSPVDHGTFVDFYRKKPDGTRVKTGIAQIKQDQANGYQLALVLESSTKESQILNRDYPEIMVGDFGISQPVTISRIVQVSPTKQISYFKLFRDPNAYPNTFELSEAGKKTLTKAASAFANSKLPTLLIEAHTDAAGDSSSNQVESYQRAVTIRQFLINHLNFDPDRVVALGMGELEPLEEKFLPDYGKRARRIVLKAKGLRF